ncbi:uncharacterized protein LOC123534707 [Mercenaria mercenaria]|uniref:uncharacterized protein LOC123534707 n=1 Tax=Mercenaria mercenaria TaxID=6596 RepID=UPI00234F3338|nr:uncharacterized protein LOC123534707 [Mercenaria mercenaria]
MNTMEAFQATLKKHRSSFEVLENLPVNKEDIRKIKDKLLKELKSEEYNTDIEYHRTKNLISFLCFVLKDFQEADKYAKEVLESNADNIVALSNKVWFSIRNCSMNQQCKDNLKKLQSLKKNNIACLVAKADIAFTYSRIGIKGYDKAKRLYKDIIDECDGITGNETKVDRKLSTDYFSVWMFGYALVEKRMLNLSNSFNEDELDLSLDNYRRVIKLYCRIISLRQKDSSICVKRFQARSYADVGLLVYNVRKTSPRAVLEIHLDNADLPKQPEEYIRTALDIFPNDIYVLEKSGQYYRYARNNALSIKYLTKAVETKGTSHAHHHLALSLKRKLDIDVGNIVYEPMEGQGKRSARKMLPVKSPLYLKSIDYTENKDVADMILQYLDKSVEIAFNTGAMYDKGLFYRQLGMTGKALESFEYIIKNEDEHSSRMYLANAYEQAGICLRDMFRKRVRSDLRKDIEQKMKMYLKSSIEISCSFVANVPALKSCWKSASTLESIIEDKEDLLFLHEKMDRHQEALEVLKELEELAQTQDEYDKILKEKVNKYNTLGLYDDAVIALSTMPNVLDTIGEEMCLQIYVKAGIDALKKGYDRTARYRVQRALEIRNRKKTNEANAKPNVASVEERYDVFILCNTEDEENGKKLMDIMIRTGVRTTLNTDRLLPGTSMTLGMTQEMKKANHFIIIFDFDADDRRVANRITHLMERLQSIVEAREPGSSSIIVIKAITCDMVPDIFLGYKTINMELHTVPEDFTKNENACKSVKELIIAILSSS